MPRLPPVDGFLGLEESPGRAARTVTTHWIFVILFFSLEVLNHTLGSGFRSCYEPCIPEGSHCDCGTICVLPGFATSFFFLPKATSRFVDELKPPLGLMRETPGLSPPCLKDQPLDAKVFRQAVGQESEWMRPGFPMNH